MGRKGKESDNEKNYNHGNCFLMVAGLVACANPLEAAVSQMAENNGSQEASDSGSSGDSQMDIDINEDGGSINISGEDGNVSIQGDDNGMAWPADKLSGVPEIPGVKVVMVMDMGEGIMVGFEDCDQSTAQGYISTLKSSGWEAAMEINADDGYSSVFTKGNESIQFTWSGDENAGSILYGVSG